ncbi:mechanosensitive ion channel [Desulfobotulus sp. H1]|uniref:Mechanosensitive ion channel n=1 Tax=Desulfobotulus pelophilus TaxID=2823377 RepID=A0ABT3NB60_9BACT|nr:mechanosensitive ion channel domain-containing protein [Desulfobotulus pelophilus]MCW7754701.1 mechanosensitive ion channel [Desulfobotulus pelophilus]
MVLRILILLSLLLSGNGAYGFTNIPLAELSLSLTASVKDETQILEELSRDIEHEQKLDTITQSEIRAFRILAASHRNLILASHTPITDLERARADQQASITSMDNHLQRIQRQLERMGNLRMQTENRQKITHEQKESLSPEEDSSAAAEEVRSALSALITLLEKKHDLIIQMEKRLHERKTEIRELRQDTEELSLSLQKTLRDRRAIELFQKQEGFRALLDPSTPLAILLQIRENVFRLLSPEFWQSEISPLLQISPTIAIRLLIATLFLLPLFLRLLTQLKKMERLYPEGWRTVLLESTRRTLPFMVMAIAMEGCMWSLAILSATGFFKTASSFMWFLALFRMLTAFQQACQKENRPSPSPEVMILLRHLTRAQAVFVPVLLVSIWIFPPSSPLLFVARLSMEIFIAMIIFRFWSGWAKPAPEQSSQIPKIGLHISTKAIAIGALLLELFGYGTFALFWYWGWGVTFIAIGAYILLLAAIKEWTPPQALSSDDKTAANALFFKRMGIQSLPFVLIPLPILLIAKAWRLHENILPLISGLLSYPITFGNMQFSLLRFIQTLSVLIITLMITRSFRAFVEKRILMESGMEQGLKASILTLLGYLIWGIGILAALHVFGLNTTTLTVAFGALGVGLGFGLQAIFNNFVSGIILLFERPIQVGDVIEIDGIWATVMRINVRSTVVQTYDNATLIIPNADFISSRLINWSFKDQRIRRNIDIGVAYSSDVRKVEKVLLEIGNNTKHVLTYPAPDVHFMNFGDSALIFRLRFWSTLDHFRRVETQIRFQITDDFRKENIEIPFPQNDLHIRSDYRFDMQKAASLQKDTLSDPTEKKQDRDPPHLL